MFPELFHIPYFVLALLAGGTIGFSLGAESKRPALAPLCAAALAALGAGLAYAKWGMRSVPVQGYGTMILVGFCVGLWMTARRARRIAPGVEPKHIVDIAIVGVVVGLFGARLMHVIAHWNDPMSHPDERYNPFQASGFVAANILNWFKLWNGGLVFYGAFLLVIPGAWLCCRRAKIPALRVMDATAPGLIVGQAFGRLGCLLKGCCFGKESDAAWAVQFPRLLDGQGNLAGAPAYVAQFEQARLEISAASSLPVHPTQLYAALAAGLTAAFLYAYWPHRKYDGQILSLMLIMAGATRFFEELLRCDTRPPWPAVADWITLAQWLAIGIFCAGVALLLYFRARSRTLNFEP